MTTREKEKLERKYVEMRDLLEDLSMQIEEIREEYIYEMDDLEDEETQLDRKGGTGRYVSGNSRHERGGKAGGQAGIVQENHPEYVKKRRFAGRNSRDFGTPDRDSQSMGIGKGYARGSVLVVSRNL